MNVSIEEMCVIRPDYSIWGFGIQQSYSALFVLDRLLQHNTDISTIIELGTCSGGLALFFGSIMKHRQGRTLTFDIEEPDPVALRLFPFLDIEFYRQDIFASEERIKETLQAQGRTLLFCDGGNKIKEFNTFAHLLKPNDLIMAHDYYMEIRPEDIQLEIKMILEHYWQDKFDALRTHVLSMRRR